MHSIKFSHDYKKLDFPVFPTIRRNDWYDVNQLYMIRTPSKEFKAEIILKVKRKLCDIPTNLLLYDTDKQRRDQALDLISSFYRKPLSMNEIFTILFLHKISYYQYKLGD